MKQGFCTAKQSGIRSEKMTSATMGKGEAIMTNEEAYDEQFWDDEQYWIYAARDRESVESVGSVGERRSDNGEGKA